jgi:hypothetical protein
MSVFAKGDLALLSRKEIRGGRRQRGAAVRKIQWVRVWVTVRLYAPWKTTMTSGQNVSKYFGLGFRV